MKRIILLMLCAAMMAGCAQDRPVEERYVYEGDKVVDVDTGDEYLMEEEDVVTIVHTDGTRETIAVEDTPFYGTTVSDQYFSELQSNLTVRKEKILEEKKNKMKDQRRAKYEGFSDDELLEQFKDSHQKGEDMAKQMEMMSELVERGVVNNEDAPNLLEVPMSELRLEPEVADESVPQDGN